MEAENDSYVGSTSLEINLSVLWQSPGEQTKNTSGTILCSVPYYGHYVYSRSYGSEAQAGEASSSLQHVIQHSLTTAICGTFSQAPEGHNFILFTLVFPAPEQCPLRALAVLLLTDQHTDERASENSWQRGWLCLGQSMAAAVLPTFPAKGALYFRQQKTLASPFSPSS